jgi:hypothetical protein
MNSAPLPLFPQAPRRAVPQLEGFQRDDRISWTDEAGRAHVGRVLAVMPAHKQLTVRDDNTRIGLVTLSPLARDLRKLT